MWPFNNPVTKYAAHGSSTFDKEFTFTGRDHHFPCGNTVIILIRIPQMIFYSLPTFMPFKNKCDEGLCEHMHSNAHGRWGQTESLT